MILSTRCAGCGRRGPVLCRTCRFALLGRPAVDAPDGVVVASVYSGRVRDILLGLKYQNRRPVGAHLGGVLARRLVAELGLRGRGTQCAGSIDGHPRDRRPIEVVTWAPTSRHRARQRGFDQASLIARAVAAHLGVPCRRLLEREGTGSGQTGRGRRERLDPQGGPRFRSHPHVAGLAVLVVDDVVTTGATLRAAADALVAAGAASVVTAAVAATPGCLRPVERVA